MDNLKIILPLFVLMALAQLYVPAKMIIDSEDVLNTGTEYKFQTAPIDPTDPFRGKYITLNYKQNKLDVVDEKDWYFNQNIYVRLSADENGFAKIHSPSPEKPQTNEDYIKVKITRVTSRGQNKITISYPFNKFFMEESKAYNAEVEYRDATRSEKAEAYALVNVKNGKSVLKDVIVKGVSVKDLMKEN